ncbi:MAG: hypothetical protein QM605_15895 [Sphingobium sp.]
MADIRRLSAQQLQNYLLNAIRYMDERPEDSARLIPEILGEMVARRERSSSAEHPLTSLGYNVRWRDWHARERQRLLGWLMDARLPRQVESVMGTAGSLQRKSYIRGTIERWSRIYGGQPNMEQARARWLADLAFIDARAAEGDG